MKVDEFSLCLNCRIIARTVSIVFKPFKNIIVFRLLLAKVNFELALLTKSTVNKLLNKDPFVHDLTHLSPLVNITDDVECAYWLGVNLELICSRGISRRGGLQLKGRQGKSTLFFRPF